MEEAAVVRIVDDTVLDGGGRDRAPDLVEVPDAARLRDVAALGRVDRVEVARPLAVLRVLAENTLGSSVYATAVPANGALLIMNRNQLWSLSDASSPPAAGQ